MSALEKARDALDLAMARVERAFKLAQPGPIGRRTPANFSHGGEPIPGCQVSLVAVRVAADGKVEICPLSSIEDIHAKRAGQPFAIPPDQPGTLVWGSFDKHGNFIRSAVAPGEVRAMEEDDGA